MSEVSGAVVVAPLGPNPAPLVELAWALAARHERPLRVEQAYLPLLARARHYLDREVLAPGAALDELGYACAGLLPREGVFAFDVTLASGEPIEDDAAPGAAEAFREAVWTAARDAQASAGLRPVVFALAGGRLRSMTALVTTAYQLLAREQDLCIDVRVDDPRAEGGTGFFFPAQQRQALLSRKGEPFVAGEVGISLVELPLPRLRGLLLEHDLKSFAAALARGQQAVDLAGPPTLRFECDAGEVYVNDQLLPLTRGEFAWFLALALARCEAKTPQEGWLSPPIDAPELVRVLKASNQFEWGRELQSPQMKSARSDEGLRGDKRGEGKGQAISTLRSRALAKIRRWCLARGGSLASFLKAERRYVREKDGRVTWGEHRQRLVLAAEHIVIHGIPVARNVAPP